MTTQEPTERESVGMQRLGYIVTEFLEVLPQPTAIAVDSQEIYPEALAASLIRHGLVHTQAWDDAGDWDGGQTSAAIKAVARDLGWRPQRDDNVHTTYLAFKEPGGALGGSQPAGGREGGKI